MYSCNLRDGFYGILLEIGNSSPQGIGFAYGEEFNEECHGAFAPGIESFLVLVEPLFHLPHEGERKQTESYSIKCDVFDDDCVQQFKEGL
jgi:hypothetical protein